MPSAVPAPDSDRAADLIARSRELRRQAGVGFGRMAAEAAINKSHLSQLERGLASPGRRARTWLAILEVLDRTDAPGAG
jgi:transcriptional regulator with XRE-family HTH domain